MAASRRLKPLPAHDTGTGVDIADLIGGRREARVEIRRYDDLSDPDSPYMVLGHLNVVYDPTKITGRFLVQGEDAMAKSVCRAVLEWDLKLRGEPVPVGDGHVDEVADRVPALILNSVIVGILEDTQLNPRSGTPSSSI